MDPCYRCRQPGTERAHVFGRQLFPKPRPHNLITVPACSQCNRGVAEDERYFAAFVCDYWHQAGRRLWDTQVKPRIQHPKSRGLRGRLAASVNPLLVPTGDDRGLGNLMYADRNRIDRVIEHMIRGLTYYHAAGRVLTEVEFTISLFGEQEKGVPLEFLQLVRGLPHHKLGQVVDYRWGQALDDPMAIVAAIGFFQRKWFTAVAVPKESLNATV